MAYFFFVIISFSYLGAVETAKKYKCTQKQALDSKEFSAGYWNWATLVFNGCCKTGRLVFCIYYNCAV